MVRDAQGFVLAQDTLQARFVRYFGFGVWALNNLLDVFARDDSEKLTGSVLPRDLTRDFDAQVSQIVFNAKRRADAAISQLRPPKSVDLLELERELERHFGMVA